MPAVRARGVVVAAVVVGLRRVALAGRVVVARVVVADPGRAVRERAGLGGLRGDGHAEVGERAAEVGLGRRLAVELDADGAGRVGLGLDDAGLLAQPLGHGPGAALVAEPVGGPQHVAVAPGDAGAPARSAARRRRGSATASGS